MSPFDLQTVGFWVSKNIPSIGRVRLPKKEFRPVPFSYHAFGLKCYNKEQKFKSTFEKGRGKGPSYVSNVVFPKSQY